MSLTLEQKKAVVAEVAEVAKVAHSAVAAEYRGLTVGELTELRARRATKVSMSGWSRIPWPAVPWKAPISSA